MTSFESPNRLIEQASGAAKTHLFVLLETQQDHPGVTFQRVMINPVTYI